MSGLGSTPAAAGQTPIVVNVPSGQTSVLHSTLLSGLNALEYFISVRNADFSKNRSFKMTVTKLDVGLRDTVFAKVGSSLSYTVSAGVNGANAELNLHNNEAFDLTVSFNYIKI